MKYPFIETIPDVLKLHRPSVYEGESFTALEYVSKNSAKLNECIEEINTFFKDVSNLCEEYKTTYYDKQDMFERVMEQRFSDFINTIKLKYASQDKVIDDAIQLMITNLPEALMEAINEMYSNNEFDEIVYNSIANLRSEFDNIVNNTTNFQNVINTSISNMSASMEAFKSNVNTSFETLENELRSEIENIISDSDIADMAKVDYDSNGDGVVNDSDKLGGFNPSYYAKKQELDATNSIIETLNNSISVNTSQIAIVTETATQAKSKAETATTKANEAISKVEEKLGKYEKAEDTRLFNGELASFYAKASDSISTYSHTKIDNAHYLTGNGDNIKFVATASFAKDDIFYINETEVTAVFQNGDTLTDGYFKAGYVVSCFLNGNVLNFKSGGAGVNLENITVYSGSNFPVSPKENNLFINANTKTAYMYVNGEWTDIDYKTLSVIKSLTVDKYTHNNTSTLNWDTVEVGAGFNKATYNINIENSNSIFYVGISTSANKPPHTAVDKPDGSILNFKSVNGDIVGNKTGVIQLDIDTTYYLYIASYYGSNNSTVSIEVEFE